MNRRISHSHPDLGELKIIQHLNERDQREKTIKKGGDFKLDTSVKSYYLEFHIPRNNYFTINFAKTYGIEKSTRKRNEDQPNMDRIIYKVHHLPGPFDDSTKPITGDVEVKDPDIEPFDE